MYKKLETVDEIYNGFWKDIVEKEDGTIDIEQVKKELSDFYVCMDNVPQVYAEITNGTLSKVTYPANTIIGLFHDYFINKSWLYDDLMDMINDQQADNDDIVSWIKEYIEDFKGV